METKLGFENGQTNTTEEGKPETKEKKSKKGNAKKAISKNNVEIIRNRIIIFK